MPVSERDHIQGSPDARVTLVEYGDYQCPSCLQAFPIMIDIQEHMGDQMRLVKLPPDSPRGGVLTQGTVLASTSNPDRTSPVKRGLYILDNLLGVPPPPRSK